MIHNGQSNVTNDFKGSIWLPFDGHGNMYIATNTHGYRSYYEIDLMNSTEQ
jgi:hypothetical protein